jgi:mitofilin
VSNLQEEQEALVSQALQEQGSEFSEVLEQQWEASVVAIAAQAQELEQEYSQKLNDFKVAYTSQMQKEETEKLNTMRNEYETDKASALSSQEQDLIQKWEAIVAEKVDQERDGRLAKLDKLAVKVQILHNITEDMASRLEQKYKLQKIEIALENLSTAIAKSPGSIEAEFNNLWMVGSKYPFISTILSSLPKDIALSGVSEFNDLVTSFLQLRTNISSIKYMPENGGAVSYLISSFGPRSQIGELTSEVLEKSSDSMANGDIDSTARQLNRLRGWQRVLALDWLSDARRYLELKQALDVNILSINNRLSMTMFVLKN